MPAATAEKIVAAGETKSFAERRQPVWRANNHA
jgi:hypothetical protein